MAGSYGKHLHWKDVFSQEGDSIEFHSIQTFLFPPYLCICQTLKIKIKNKKNLAPIKFKCILVKKTLQFQGWFVGYNLLSPDLAGQQHFKKEIKKKHNWLYWTVPPSSHAVVAGRIQSKLMPSKPLSLI